MIITIDGPTASGKSTVARHLAQQLGYYYLNTGLLYRALSYLLVTHYGYTENTVLYCRAEDIANCFYPEKFLYVYDNQTGEHISFAGEDITPYLKDSFIDKISSI